ncbi:hypothetical protein [uncultured Winogradskyella sp.]|uniref:hypothetical protein n=1 Tax=uncultured Winogradskyella sp. TaxID=395353 RepID=UPI0026270475|nr:hypothetical protein [uncultured Winogradskyella sp.]
METQIIKWKNMWQEQKSNTLESNELIERLNQMERDAQNQRTKLIVVSIILITACSIGASELLANKYYLISFIMLLTGVFIKLLPLYKSKYEVIYNESDFNNRDFIQNLTKKMDYSIKHLLIYMSVIITALNIALLGLNKNGTIFNFEINDENRMFFHLATVILFVVAYIFNKKNLDVNRRKTLSLISDLENKN